MGFNVIWRTWGEEFGCTKERIRQVKEKAMKKLRNESFTLLKYL